MNVNVYEELGYPNAEEQFLKATLVSRVGDIIRGRFRDISIEKLMRIATSLHHSIHIVIDPTPSESAGIFVEVAGETPSERVVVAV